MKTRIRFINILICLLICTGSLAQTGESKFRKVSINARENVISDLKPSFDLAGLRFTDKNDSKQIDGREEGDLRFFIINTGPGDLEPLTVTINEINKVQGLKYDSSRKVSGVKNRDSLLVTIPLAAGEDLKEGFALFKIDVGDSKDPAYKTVQITIPTKQSFTVPFFVWTVPNSALEKTGFPLYEISGILKSKTRITGLNIVINGMIPADQKTFTILPTENTDEYLVKRVLTLDEGYNEIKIEAHNDLGASVSEPRVVNYFVQKIDRMYSEKRVALVIGNADYIYGNTLINPVNDAKAISASLKELGFTVFTFLDADQKTMKRAIDEFGVMLKDYNVALFYFAGHGSQVKGVNYLIPVDASLRIEQDVDYDCIDVGRLLGKMEAAATATNIVILDACRDNPFERSWSGRSSGKGNGLAFMNAPSGSLIAYATSPGKTASDGSGKNGLYTEALLQFINVPGQPIEEFFKNVRNAVEIKSNKAQTPWESTSLKGNFFFRIK